MPIDVIHRSPWSTSAFLLGACFRDQERGNMGGGGRIEEDEEGRGLHARHVELNRKGKGA